MNKETKNYVKDMILWFYEAKKSFEASKVSFEETKFDFENCMDRYFDTLADDDNKIKIPVKDKLKNVSHIVLSKIQPTVVIFDVDKIKALLNKKERKLVIKRTITVNNWQGMFDYLKEQGIDFKEFSKFITITESIDEKQLQKLVDLGMIDEEEVKPHIKVKMKKPYYKVTEK